MDTNDLFQISGDLDFSSRALEVYRYQYRNNPTYREFCDHLGRGESAVHDLSGIPFLPIEFFRSRQVVCGHPPQPVVFQSSGTTGTRQSHHYVADIGLYKQSFLRAFELFYGPVADYCILALLPSYLEREGSSLIYMVRALIKRSGHPESGFYLHDLAALRDRLLELRAMNKKTLLLGVSFALLDFAERYPVPIPGTIVMETGGMKGRKKEMVRDELHRRLKKGFGVPTIHSEYGMTELLSQAYSEGEGRFRCPPWMKVLIRDPEDPLSILAAGKAGGVNLIDLANLHSCSFIATQDLGKVYNDGSFEILGRFDHSDIRGCNLMVL